MKWSTIIAVIVVIVVALMWAILLKSSDEHPAMMPSLAGCYLPVGGDQSHQVHIAASGGFQYGVKTTSVVPYKDKQSWSLLPKSLIQNYRA